MLLIRSEHRCELRLEPQAENYASLFRVLSLETGGVDRCVKVRGGTGVFSASTAKAAICSVQITGALTVGIADLAALLQKVRQPVAVFPIKCRGFLNTFRLSDTEVVLDNFLGSFDHPRKNGRTGIVEKVVGVVFDITAAIDPCVEWHNDQSAPSTRVIGTDFRQVIRV